MHLKLSTESERGVFVKRTQPFKVAAFLLVSFLIVTATALFAEGPMEKFADKNIDRFEKGCQTELETYCQTVTPGEGRGLACIYAHSDKLSRQCESALYDSAVEFQNAVNNLNAFVGACKPDIVALCSKVAIGEGRILACLEKNKGKVSASCNEARQQVRGDLGHEKNISSQHPATSDR